MKNLILALLTMSFTSVYASPVHILETTKEFAEAFKAELGSSVEILSTNNQTTLMVSEDDILRLSEIVHSKTHKCGGFIDITDENPKSVEFAKNKLMIEGSEPLPMLAAKKPQIEAALNTITGESVKAFTVEYSGAFLSRNAKSTTGVQAPDWLANKWIEIAKAAGRDDVKVETVLPPSGYSQKNVRVTIPGTDPRAAIVVLGGHLDSINQSFGNAPGADDNASGIAALTEAYRAILKSGIKTTSTIEIFGYAAEEYGLYGSRAIAENYSNNNVRVKGAFQLDMVAYPSTTKAVTFYDDYTDPKLTQWTEQVFGLYVGTAVKHSKCGYACSDHASWNRFGFASVFPFESPFENYNHRIHTAKDLWDSQLDAEFSSYFSKLAVAYALELSEISN